MSVDLRDLQLHDAILDEVAVQWHTRTCVLRLRNAGPDGGRSLELRWHGVAEVQMSREAHWGAPVSVLETRSAAGGVDELLLQSGHSIRVRAEGLTVEEGPEALEDRYGALIADALVTAGLVTREAFEMVAAVAADEIRARRGIGDV